MTLKPLKIERLGSGVSHLRSSCQFVTIENVSVSSAISVCGALGTSSGISALLSLYPDPTDWLMLFGFVG
jgi:hypothetical protein